MERSRNGVERPSGALSGPRRVWRTRVGDAIVGALGLLRRTPIGAVLHRRLLANLEISNVDVELDRPRAPRSLDVVFLSDLHAGDYMTAEDLEDVARRTMALVPDLVCFGGDLVDSTWKQVRHYDRALEILKPPLGVWAVAGNHEYYRPHDVALWRAHLEERGVRVLVNEGARVEHRVEHDGGGTLWIAGVDDLTEGTPDLVRALDGRAQDEPALLLSHHPDLFVAAAARGVDLQLSGHTHGGQICLFGWTPLPHTRLGYWRGLHRLGESRLYVGRGVGATVLPFRVGAPPEIVQLRLRGPG